MFKLNESFPDTFEFNGVVLAIDLSFDNVLDMFETFNDESMETEERILAALSLLIGEAEADKLIAPQRFELLIRIMDEFFKGEEEPVKLDLLGNPMKTKKSEVDFSLEHDAEFIYVSFMQAYQIDLHQEFGRMHWNKFKVLLNNLPSDTKLNQVREIRNWKPDKDSTSEERQKMAELQEIYALPSEEEEEG